MAHSNDLATADMRREEAALDAEVAAFKLKFEALKADVKVLYTDKIHLGKLLATAKEEADQVEGTVANYRRASANLIE